MATSDTNASYHQVTTGDNTEYYVKSQDIDPVTMSDALTTAASVAVPAAPAAPRRSYAYRKMALAEFEAVMKKGGMLEPMPNATSGEKWFTEDLHHSRQFQNKGVLKKGVPEVVAEFKVKRDGYKAIRKEVIPQQGSKALQKPGAMKNIFNTERLENHPRGKVNIGLKGKANVDAFNTHVVSVTKVNPGSAMNKSVALRWLRRNKLSVAATAVGVVLDGISLTLSVIEDGGKFGPSTTINVAGIVGGALGSAIGGALGSLFPVIGNTIGSFLGGLIGSLIANGITKFFLAHSPVVPGPGPPLLDVDPFATAFGAPRMGQGVEPYEISQDTPAGAFGFPDMEHDVEQEFPAMDFDTR